MRVVHATASKLGVLGVQVERTLAQWTRSDSGLALQEKSMKGNGRISHMYEGYETGRHGSRYFSDSLLYVQ
jgi:hypothetical protein